ncbi:MAG: hypothetical protein LBO74_14905 [Candidatus Symbiothrix sp.]|jgi:hypothetical protein|nr:hypothetical protein [Candidatus Symbiothrix sp.]
MEQLATLEAPVRKKKRNCDYLKQYFSFEEPPKEEAFLADNPDIVEILPSIAKDIKTNLDENAQLVLHLLDMGEDWRTLFIYVYTRIDRKITSHYQSVFFDKMFRLFPEISKNLNLAFLHYEI